MLDITLPEVQAFFKANREKCLRGIQNGAYFTVDGPFYNGRFTNRINTLSYSVLNRSTQQWVKKLTDTTPYHLNQNLYWLTGIQQPEEAAAKTTALFVKEADGKTKFILFTDLHDHPQVHLYGADEVYPSLITPPNNAASEKVLSGYENRVRQGTMVFLEKNLSESRIIQLRLMKSDFEKNQIRAITNNTARSIILTMQNIKTSILNQITPFNENDIQRRINNTLLASTTPSLSFGTCVSGKNDISCTNAADQMLNPGDLIFINAGATMGMTTDITAVFPVSGKFTDAQKALYEVILTVNQQLIAAAQNGVRVNDLEASGIRKLTEGLINLGLLSAPLADRLEEKAHKQYFNDSIFRWIGFNLFDPCPYLDENKDSIPIRKDMVFALSMSLSIPQNSSSPYAGISVCIRDVLVMNDTHAENLTKLPRTVAEIENFMSPQSSATLWLTRNTTGNGSGSNHNNNNNSNNNSNHNNTAGSNFAANYF